MKLFGLKRRPPPQHLGELEVAVMEVAWHSDTTTARSTHQRLADRGITLSTVQSTLERLSRKGLLSRSKHGRAYAYRAQVTREALIAGLMQELSDQFATGRIEPLLSGFLTLVDGLGAAEGRSVRKALRERLEEK